MIKPVFMKFVGFYWVNRKLFKIFIVTLLCGALKGSMKALKTFTKPSETPQRSVKIKLNSYFNTTFRNPQDVKG